ncbi:hypothetical protein Aperf_G00000113450 [Anoplocephala perfoliata]
MGSFRLHHHCNQRNEMLFYKVLGDMVEAIIGAVFVDCGGVTSIVTSVIYNLMENEIGEAFAIFGSEAYGKSPPMDPVRLMHEMYPDMEITVVESSVSYGSGAYNELPTWITDKRKTANQNRPRVKVMAKYKGLSITGEGFNTRTAKLEVAQKLGIGTS